MLAVSVALIATSAVLGIRDEGPSAGRLVLLVFSGLTALACLVMSIRAARADC